METSTKEQALSAAIAWHDGLVRSLHDRQLWAGVAGLIGILLYNFTGLHVRPDAILSFILLVLGWLGASATAQVAHTRSAAALTQALATLHENPTTALKDLATTFQQVARAATAFGHEPPGASPPAGAPPTVPPAPPA